MLKQTLEYKVIFYNENGLSIWSFKTANIILDKTTVLPAGFFLACLRLTSISLYSKNGD